MRDYIVADGTVTETALTPAQRKHHRTTGHGIIITAHDEHALRLCLPHYFPEEQ